MPEKISRKPLTIPEAAEILRSLDLNKADQIQKRTLDYTTKFSKIDAEKARKLRKELQEKCGLTEDEAVEVINIMPGSIEELRTFTSGWKKLLPTETLENILKLIKSYS